MRWKTHKWYRIFRSIGFAVLLTVLLGCGKGGGGTTSTAPITNTGNNNGNGNTSGDTTPPVLAMIAPTEAELVDYKESQFRDPYNFYIQFSYSDASPMNESSLLVTMKMDDEATVEITEYFTAINSTNIRSTDLHIYTQSLWVVSSNEEDHDITVYASINDNKGNTGSATAQFLVKYNRYGE